MAQVPRIRRAEPSGPATQPRHGIPVLARLVWHDGATDEVEALAVAWTATEVEIEWTTPWHQRRRDWIRAEQVARRWPEEGLARSADPAPTPRGGGPTGC